PARRRGSDRVIPSDLSKDDSKSRLGDCVQHCCHFGCCWIVGPLGSGSAHECGSSGHELVHHYCGRECAIAPAIEIAARGHLVACIFSHLCVRPAQAPSFTALHELSGRRWCCKTSKTPQEKLRSIT